MAGGTWTTQSKIRPGAYINVRSNSMNISMSETRGIVTMPWAGGFGTVGEIIELTPTTNTLNILGYSLGAPEMLTIREAFKRASQLLIYRVGGGTPATITDNGLTITAQHVGGRGNDITVKIRQDVDNESIFIVQTFLASARVAEQRASTIEELVANDFVRFSGAGVLANKSGLVLTGGTDAQPTSGDYSQYFEALEAYEFNTMALPIEDASVKQVGVAYIERLRNDEGRKCQLVVAGVTADSEAVINVKNGVILSDNTVVEPHLATAWVAAATAGANINESNTNSVYAQAVNVTERYSNTKIEQALLRGEFVFTERRGQVRVEQDINSLTSFSVEKNEAFSKNRVIRVLDGIVNMVSNAFINSFMGTVTNNAQGRNVLKSMIIEGLDDMQNVGAVENFSADDVVVVMGLTKHAVVANLYVQPTDAIEQLYMDVTVVKED